MKSHSDFLRENWFDLTMKIGRDISLQGKIETGGFEIPLLEKLEERNIDIDIDILINLLRLRLGQSIDYSIRMSSYGTEPEDEGYVIDIDCENRAYVLQEIQKVIDILIDFK